MNKSNMALGDFLTNIPLVFWVDICRDDTTFDFIFRRNFLSFYFGIRSYPNLDANMVINYTRLILPGLVNSNR